MRAEDWDSITHFHAGENWGDWTKMAFEYVRFLDTVRHLADTPFELTSPAYTKRTGHSKDSYHYYGHAADFCLPKLRPFDAYDKLVSVFEDMGVYGKIGFGFYPDGGSVDSTAQPFFHLDDRAMHKGVLFKPGVVWVRIDNPDRGLKLGYTYGADALRFIASIRPRQEARQ